MVNHICEPIQSRRATSSGSDRTLQDGDRAPLTQLYAYWQEKRGTRPAPERTEIEPGAIRGVLADAFILALDRGAGHPIRLAGTRMCALFGREIKGESFLDLWASTDRPTMEDLLSILSDECTGTVAGAIGQNENGESLELELLLLPLSIRRPIFARAIGVLAPLKIPLWLGANPLGPVTIGSRRHVGAAIERRLMSRLAPRGRRGFLVYYGGGRPIPTQSEDGPPPRSAFWRRWRLTDH
ncbi:MAG: PAS domain-containing protein [Xanthobacteraceae bacterium]